MFLNIFIFYFLSLNPTDLVIRVGEWDTQTVNEVYPHQDAQVSKIIKHKDYYGGALYNDVALIFLTDPLILRENVGTLCLPPQNYKFSSKVRCYATGWGKNVYGKQSKTLNDLNFFIIFTNFFFLRKIYYVYYFGI